MPSVKLSAPEKASRERGTRDLLRWYISVSGLLNVVLLLQVINRFHHAFTPINHGLARVLATALLVNLAGAAAIVWLSIGRSWESWLDSVVKADLVIALLPFVMASLRNGENARVFRLFALVYVIFLLCRMSELLIYAAKNSTRRTARLPIIVFAAAFIVYGGLTPWMSLASPPQGDESHLLILTHSLVFDHDFDVGDNYSNGDYKEQFPPPSPGAMRGYPYAFIQRDGIAYLPHEPHTVINSRGQVMSEHDIGFPLLMVPGYAVDLREGALFTVALIAAAGAAAVFEIAAFLGASSSQALVTVFLFCFTTPYLVFTQAVLLDIPGAVGLLWIALQFFRYRERPQNRYLLLAGIVIAILPWLNIRYWSVAGLLFLILSAWILYRGHDNWRSVIPKMAFLGVPSLVGLVLFAAIDKALFNMYRPNAGLIILTRTLHHFHEQPIHGFLGIMFDQSYGLIPTAPLYVAAAAGMVVLFRHDRWGFAALFVPALGYLPIISSSQFWFGGWCAPGRYILPVAMLMTPAAALVLNRKVRWVIVVLGAWSFLIAILFTVNPYLRMPSVWVFYQMSMLVEFFHDQIHTPGYSILSIYPNMMRARITDYLRACFWLIAFIAAAWGWSRTVKQEDAGLSAQLR